MRRTTAYLLAMGLTFSIPCLGGASEDMQDINVPMTEIGRLLESTFPLIYDDEAFSNPKNKKTIEQKLDRLQTLLIQTQPHLARKSITFKVSSEVLDEELSKAQSAFKNQQYSLAQHVLKGLPSVCTSCHLQDRQSHKLFSQAQDAFTSDPYQLAEFNFVTRDYQQAMKYYDQFLQSESTASKQIHALDRMLVLYSEVYKRPDVIRKKLAHYLEFNHLDPSAKAIVKDWLVGLDEYMTQSGISDKGINYNQLDKYMGQHFTQLENAWVPNLTDNKDKVFYVMLRASLHEYLNKHAAEAEIPALLYWLAVCDKSLEFNFYFSLSDWYLKECVRSYPENPYAVKCYHAYEDYMRFSYTGSMGTNLPESVQSELADMKKLLQKHHDQLDG